MTEFADPGSSAVRWLDEDEQRAWRALIGVLVRLPPALDRQLRHDSDLSHIEYQVLAVLSEAPERTSTMTRLASMVDATPPRLSQVARRLEERGMLHRSPAPGDGRVTLATLSHVGWQALRGAAPGHVAEVRSLVFDPLSTAQVRQLEEIAGLILAAADRSPLR